MISCFFLSFVVGDFELNLGDALGPGKFVYKYHSSYLHILFLFFPVQYSSVNDTVCFCTTHLLNIVTPPDPAPKPEKPAVPPPKPGGGEFSAHLLFDYFLYRTKPPCACILLMPFVVVYLQVTLSLTYQTLSAQVSPSRPFHFNSSVFKHR